MGPSRLVSSLVLVIVICSVHAHGAMLLDSCLSDADCEAGLYCGSFVLAGAAISRCIRDTATPLTNSTSSLPFNKVSWLATHNSFAITGFPQETGVRVTFTNQEDNVTSQLNNGVRGLLLDTYDFNNDVWLCHSFAGACYNTTAFEPLLITLNQIETFLSANPSEIVTIFLEDYVAAPNGLTTVFTAANLMQYWFPVASMPTNGADWPTIDTMLTNNWRLLVFTSQQSKQAAEGIAYQWSFMNENQYGDSGMQLGSCSNREESKPMNNTSVSLIFENFFPTSPNVTQSTFYNSDSLYSQLPVCYAASGNRWANFIAVDFYKRSTGGGSFQAVDKLNGQAQCGCNSSLSCETQTTPGQCSNDPSLAELQSTSSSPQSSQTAPSGTNNGSTVSTPPLSTDDSGTAPGSLPARTFATILVAIFVTSWATHSPF